MASFEEKLGMDLDDIAALNRKAPTDRIAKRYVCVFALLSSSSPQPTSILLVTLGLPPSSHTTVGLLDVSESALTKSQLVRYAPRNMP